ncbi:MAG: septum formation initiator family protein [Lachnospiraceae bacterium]
MEKRERARRASAERTRMRRIKKLNKSNMIHITVIAGIIVGVMSIRIVYLYEKSQFYQAQEISLQEQLEAEEQRQKELKEYEKYVNTREYTEQIAKTKLGLVYPNEIIFKEKEEEK